MNNYIDKQKINKAAQMITCSQHAVIFTGAGASTESGIPDFRSPGGIWDRFDQKAFDYSSFLNSEESRILHWELFRSFSTNVSPNPAHYAIGELCQLGYIKAVITQNIDSLHQRGGAPEELVHELHGGMNNFTCLQCRRAFDLETVLQMAQESRAPKCPECKGILKPDVVFFGEPLPAKALEQAEKESKSCDLFIVIGSTLSVYPAALIPEYALSAGSKLAIINLTPTPLDGCADVVIHAKAGEVLPIITELVKTKTSTG